MPTESLQHFIDTLKDKLAKERAENARLHERVKELEFWWNTTERERDGYAAQSEQRREALAFYADESNWAVNEDSCQCGEPQRNCCCPAPANDDGAHARAAIAISPEQAREKEGK